MAVDWMYNTGSGGCCAKFSKERATKYYFHYCDARVHPNNISEKSDFTNLQLELWNQAPLVAYPCKVVDTVFRNNKFY
jgi:hypothetical protein